MLEGPSWDHIVARFTTPLAAFKGDEDKVILAAWDGCNIRGPVA